MACVHELDFSLVEFAGHSRYKMRLLRVVIGIIIAIGVILSIIQVALSAWSNPILSVGPTLSTTGALAGIWYIIVVRNRERGGD